MDKKHYYIQKAIGLAAEGMDANNGGPFGAVIVKEGRIISEACNKVTSTNDPTAHAEILAIRKACKKLGTFQLDGCEIYTSCEPCPMCLGAIYWARIEKVYYACNREDAASIGFDDNFIYSEIGKDISSREISFINFGRDEALQVFHDWLLKPDKAEY